MPDNTNVVAKPSARVCALEKERELSRALMGGTKAMREAGQKFLPKHKAESDDTYKSRISNANLYGAYKDAVGKQAGKIFAKAVILNDDVPTEIDTLAENIDGEGRALTPFAMDVLTNAMADGVAYILVDFPKTAEGATLADQKLAGDRPYWVMVKAENMLGWRTVDANGQQMLSQVRFRETITEEDGDYGEKERTRVRVLMPGKYEVWEDKREDPRQLEKWERIEEGNTTLDHITVVAVYTNRTGFMEGLPPLQALAELNQDHWISSVEQRWALTFARFAMLYAEGWRAEDMGNLSVGPSMAIPVPLGAKVGYIETTGKGIEAGATDLAAIEKRMETAGMTVRIERAGSVTATTSAIDSAEENAALKAIAGGLKDSLELALQYTAEMLRLTSGGTVKVYDEFAEPPPEGNTQDLAKLRASRDISRPTLWKELKRRRVLSEDFDEAEEQKELANDTANDLNSMVGALGSAPSFTTRKIPPPNGSATKPTPTNVTA